MGSKTRVASRRARRGGRIRRPLSVLGAWALILAAVGAQSVALSTNAGATTTVATFTVLQTDFLNGGTYALGATLTAPNGTNLVVGSGKTVALNLEGYTLTVTDPSSDDAAIEVPTGGSLTISGSGSVDVKGGSTGAGIGGGSTQSSGTITIDGGTISATGGSNGAGIGGGGGINYGSGGTVIIDGGTVTARGGGTGAGIGGGSHGSSGTVTIDNGTVTATGGTYAAGIGGGYGGDLSIVTIEGGTVVATGGVWAAGIGGGATNSGGTVTIESGASVIATSGASASAVGDGFHVTSADWSFSNAGTLDIPQGSDLVFPSGMTANNSGTIDDHGSVTGTGTIDNTGTIVDATAPAGSVSSTLTVDDDDFTIDFTVAGVPGDPSAPGALHVYAATVAASDQSLPTLTVASGYTFEGWAMPTGTAFTASTAISGTGPETLTLTPTLTPEIVTTFTKLQEDFAAGGSYALGATLTAPNGDDLVVGADETVALNLEGYTLTVTDPSSDDAAIEVPTGGSLAISGSGSLDAKGGPTGGAGIGGGRGQSAGAISISGATVTATGDGGGAGIGGGGAGSGGTTTITGGTVTATGGSAGAGIGGGYDGNGGTVTIAGGTVAATGSSFSAGIGGGEGGGGGAVTIGSGAVVTATGGGDGDASAVGDGANVGATRSSWTLTNAGTLTITQGSDLMFRTATATNSGTITDHGSISGTSTGSATLDNTGAIVDAATPAGTVSSTLTITGHDYTLEFTVAGVPGDPAAPGTLHAYTTTVAASDQSLPALTLPAGDTFYGWAHTGTAFTASTTISGTGPETLTLAPTFTAVPGAPTLSSATAGDGSVQLAWTAPSTPGTPPLSDYRVCFTRTTSTTGAALEACATSQTAGTSTSTTITGLTNGAPYSFVVDAKSSVGYGPASGEEHATPATVPSPPRDLMADAAAGEIRLTWEAPSTTGGSPLTGYEVLRGTSSGTEAPLADVGPSTLGYTDADVAAGDTYYYTVEATNAVGSSSASSEVTVSVPSTSTGKTLSTESESSTGTGMAQTPTGIGFWTVASTGTVTAHGGAKDYGSPNAGELASPVAAMVATSTGKGYWLVTARGVVYAFGTARSYGTLAKRKIASPIVAITHTTTGKGYWLVSANGTVYGVGTAHDHGTLAERKITASIVAITRTPTGRGYWLVTARGAVYPFGTARSHGTLAKTKISSPVVAMAIDPRTDGYWILEADGRVHGFGAPDLGGTSAVTHDSRAIGLVVTRKGGYWVVTSSGTSVRYR